MGLYPIFGMNLAYFLSCYLSFVLLFFPFTDAKIRRIFALFQMLISFFAEKLSFVDINQVNNVFK